MNQSGSAFDRLLIQKINKIIDTSVYSVSVTIVVNIIIIHNYSDISDNYKRIF